MTLNINDLPRYESLYRGKWLLVMSIDYDRSRIYVRDTHTLRKIHFDDVKGLRITEEGF